MGLPVHVSREGASKSHGLSNGQQRNKKADLGAGPNPVSGWEYDKSHSHAQKKERPELLRQERIHQKLEGNETSPEEDHRDEGNEDGGEGTYLAPRVTHKATQRDRS